MAEIAANEYRCENCRRVFQYAWTEEEALAEKDALFPDVPVEHCAVVCDDCFNAMNNYFGFIPRTPEAGHGK